MKTRMMVTFFLFFLVIGVPQAKDKEFAYQGKVEGMVCAFCVYNVSNKIHELPGVEKDSVNVELKSGRVEFLSKQLVSEKVVGKLFEDSGFKLLSLKKTDKNTLSNVEFSKTAQISISFPTNELSAMEDLLVKLGDLAEKQMSLVNVDAPKAIEMDLLKPIIAGRQQTIKVKFTPKNSKQVAIKIFPMVIMNEQHAK